jgi:hypothetical protein
MVGIAIFLLVYLLAVVLNYFKMPLCIIYNFFLQIY